jgi:small-conductance mechanosensitive channel
MPDLLKRGLDWLMQTHILTELSALLLALAVAWAASHFVRTWYARRPRPTSGWRALLLEAAVVSGPYLLALLVLLAARAVIALLAIDTTFLHQCLALLGALVLIRCGVFLLRLTFGHDSRLRLWENRIALVLWFFVAMHLLGWLEDFIALLDSVGLSTGKTRVTVWSVLKSLFTITVFVLISLWVARWIERRVSSISGLAVSTRIGIGKFAYAFLVGFGILLGLRASGLDLTALTVFSGAIGLGLGFGLQAIAANFVSGFVLLMDKSIKPGDVISFTGTLGTSTEGFGWVQELRGRYVVVRDRDGVETLVPNQNLITNQVINWSYSDKRVRIKLPVRVGYECDPEQVLPVLAKAAEGVRRILREPAPVTRLLGFHDYGMEVELRFWIADPEQGVNNVRSEVNRAIWRLFKEHGIRIPVAQHEIRLVDTQGRVLATSAPDARPPA